MGYSTDNYAAKGTPEYHKKMLGKLQRWLANNPKNSPLVADEADAVQWAIDQIKAQDEAKEAQKNVY